MLTIEITINGRTIHKYLVGRGPSIKSDTKHLYTIFDNDWKQLGIVEHDPDERGLNLAKKSLDMILHTYGNEGQ